MEAARFAASTLASILSLSFADLTNNNPFLLVEQTSTLFLYRPSSFLKAHKYLWYIL